MYWLTTFGATPLPQYDVAFSVGPAPAIAQTVDLPGGGVFDASGTGVARQKYPFQLRYACSVVGPSQAVALGQVNALNALIGTRAKLWREEAGAIAPVRHWCWARLVDIDVSMRAKMPHWNVPVAMSFLIMGRWNGINHRKPWTFDSGEHFDTNIAFDNDEMTVLSTSPQTVVVDNDGLQAVRDAVINVTALTAPITSLTIGVTGVTEFTWTGTLATNKTLVIDCGAKTVKNDGVGAWAGFAFTGNHKVADWLVLQPGNNSVVVSKTGGGTTSTIEFVFADGWA